MRRRALVYGSAAALLTVAVVLAAARRGRAGRASSPTGRRSRSASSRASTELLPISSSGHLILVPWIGQLALPRDAPGLQQDVRRRAPPRDARRRRRLLLGRHRALRRRLVPLRRPPVDPDADEKIAWLIFIATIPAAIAGARRRAADRGPPRQPVADRDQPRRLRRAALGRRPQRPVPKARGHRALDRARRRRGAGDRAHAGRVALGNHDHRRPLPQARPRQRRAALVLPAVPVVFGAVLYKGLKNVVFGTLPSGWEGPFLVGTVAAAGAGLIAIDLLLGYLRRHDYTRVRRLPAGLAAAILILIATGVRDATF